ncbi:MAG: branched-chain amino acid ABC transporter permease [Candidatus Aminicenantes bacterium]|nr:branched-chain amino acid ABC transporter permease [Candidatus Aminicenantes bacterium]NIM79903.1 branched-chain amino acid ABC transporter permease [Candidatus Aminicenantes bacterium]NIN19240.1 branched-chain amino acid ABC transporter permease [Candidatus Aminicenantes bacterium]NIN43145.1 branched-chain amino acid ABC transporter permease [Candidatus Aminicenantes bacterium]NIN85882.1 branched-chain amino acid ABC transporter permease [Candidatus Aminicenantes bacterium]
MDILIYGTINSVTLALIAVGFTLVYGVSRVPNFAHGSIYVLVGFLTWTFINDLKINYLLAILFSLVIAAMIGLFIYRVILIRLRGMPTSEIIASFAVGLIILEGLRMQGIGGFKGFIGPFYVLPPFVEGKVNIFGIFVDFQRLIILGIGLAIALLLWVFTHHTRIGLSLRAIAQDEQAAMMLGINSDRTAMISLAVGSALAGLAAVTILPLGNVTAEAGYKVLIHALAICIVGGLGSWTGSILAAFAIGFATKISTSLFGAVWESVVLIGTIILILLFKPSGLLGKQKELEDRV